MVVQSEGSLPAGAAAEIEAAPDVSAGVAASASAEASADGLDAEVLIVGAGPVGCWLAAELAAAGVSVIVLEARSGRVAWSRGFVVHPRTLEVFASRGAAAPLLDAGRRLPTWHFAMGASRLDFTVLPTAFPFLLLQPQVRTEELLEEHLARSGGTVLRGQRVVGLEQFKDRVTLRVRHDGVERTLAARFVVGCDGARSTVREAAGIGFTGNPDTIVSPTALVELADPPHPDDYMQAGELGLFFAIPLPDGRFVVSTVDHVVMHDVQTPWTADMVRDSVRRITGTDYGMGEPERLSTIGNSAKQAHRYRERRVLLAGDSAHVHFPMGGQGMNLGIQDAHNLAWRLTGAVRAQRAGAGSALPDALLDGYEAERRPAGEHVLEDVRAQMALVAATGADGAALRSRFEALLAEHPQVNLQYARRLAGLAVRYPVPGGDDPRIGARIPDLEVELAEPVESATAESVQAGEGAAGPVRLYELLRAVGPGRFVRLDLCGGSPGSGSDPTEPTESAAEPAESPFEVVTLAIRAVTGPDWAVRAGWGQAETVLVRPDGHVAGIGDADVRALGRACGLAVAA